ncbi:MAG: hypothetical protein M0R73_07295 [Dehalococcoidia bacterium]|nr:hypothetical protein [Dehalococcoidia bacterium]
MGELHLDLALGVRLLHVLAAVVAVGAPVALALVIRAGPEPRVVEALVARAERWQWVALAVLVATGVGNLGALGDAIPDAGSAWGRTLFAKLGFVLALLAVSAVRTFVIAGHSLSSVPTGRLAGWYGGTGALGAVIVVLAVVMAHG